MAFKGVARHLPGMAGAVFHGHAQAGACLGVAGVVGLHPEAAGLQVLDPVFAAIAGRPLPDLDERLLCPGQHGDASQRNCHRCGQTTAARAH